MFVFALIVIVVALGILFLAGDTSAIAGLSGDQFASLVALGLFGTLIASGIVASRQRFGSRSLPAMSTASSCRMSPAVSPPAWCPVRPFRRPRQTAANW